MIWLIGVILILFGLFLILTALIPKEGRKGFEKEIPEFPGKIEGEKKYGGVILIGPIPIVFGEAKIAVVALILTIILMLLALLFMLGWWI